MKITLSVEVNGTIKGTNATHINGNRITIVDFDLAKIGSSIPQLEKLKQLKGSSLAEAKELLKDFPGMKMDMNDQLTIDFTK
jgi:predicted component of type VI protein secretion system